MKQRARFVSNSSSSSFILDRRVEGVEELLSEIVAPLPRGLDRCTAKAIGREAVAYAEDWCRALHDTEPTCLGGWILKWAEELGEENLAFLRESDEGMGGWLDDEAEDAYGHPEGFLRRVQALAKDEMEYH